MDISTIIGIVGGMAAIVMSVITSGGSLAGIFDVPSLIFVVGGSYFALFISYPLQKVVGVFPIIARTFKIPDLGEKALIQNMVALAEKSRREGILALEEGLDDLDDEFMKTGIRMAVDGTDSVVIKQILSNEMNQIESRHLDWIGVVISWAGLGPGFGMMGTVIGLIGMLRNLEDKSSLGPNMAVALVTTLYGSLLANWLFTPFSTKLINQNAREMLVKEMIIEGVLSICGGDNPRVLALKLLAYLEPKARKVIEADVLKD